MEETEEKRADDETLLTPIAAARHLGITTELLFQFTKRGFAKVSGLRSLRTTECDGKTLFSSRELAAFDALLAGTWSDSLEKRPPIPKAILDHLRAESQNQCARCGSGVGVDTAHIRSWAESRSHHHHNLIRLCSSCHREHDAQHSLPTHELKAIKESLVARIKAGLMDRLYPFQHGLQPPRASQCFVGRDSEIAALVEALRLGRSTMISGSGGIGKSELLLQALSRCQTGRAVLWCDIDKFRTVGDIFSALRTAVGTGGIACGEGELSSQLDAIHACVVFDGIERGGLNDLDDFEDAVVALFNATTNTQFVYTSQILLHHLPTEKRLKLHGLDQSSARSLLCQAYESTGVVDQHGVDELLEFCDGHALTLKLAGALAEHYGSADGARKAIRRYGVQSVSIPGRQRQSCHTSLQLCLQTAYAALPENGRQLLWALSQAPAGILTPCLERDWLDLRDIDEAKASLRRWHFTNVLPVNDHITRTYVLSPVRRFAIVCGQRENKESFERVISRFVDDLAMMVAVFELKYNSPEDTPYVLQRYGAELPNLLHVLEVAKARPDDSKLVTTAIAIVKALMRYFFVLRLTEQGTGAMLDAANLSLGISRLDLAIGLAMQSIALAQRADEKALVSSALEISDHIEGMTKDPGLLADVAMCRAIAARAAGEFSMSERHAREAFNGYRGRLFALNTTADTNGSLDFERQELHNDLSHALAMLGFSLLPQGKFAQAAKAYRYSLRHMRGASIAVNRGQTLHQIGICESHLGHHKTAAKLYVEAARIFEFVGMEEYISNALCELGYTLLDDDYHLSDSLDERLVDRGLADLNSDIKRTFDPESPLEHQDCLRVIRKLFGVVILLSLSRYGGNLGGFCAELVTAIILPFSDSEFAKTRNRGDLFPIMMFDTVLHLAALIANGESDYAADGDIAHETVNEILRVVGFANDWVQKDIRIIDWLAIYLSRRWRFRGIDSDRLWVFIENIDRDVEDQLDLVR